MIIHLLLKITIFIWIRLRTNETDLECSDRKKKVVRNVERVDRKSREREREIGSSNWFSFLFLNVILFFFLLGKEIMHTIQQTPRPRFEKPS